MIMKNCETMLIIVLMVMIVTLTGSIMKMEKQARALDEARMWVDVVDIRINELQERSDAIQRECIDLL